MDVTSLLPTAPAAAQQLAEGGARASPQDLQRVARDFESVFVALLLKQMRQSIGGEGLFPGDSSDSLGGLFDMHMASHISSQRGIGLAESIQTYLAAATRG